MASFMETLDLDVPVSRAFALWSDVERWPEFLHHVERVEQMDGSRFRWWLSVPGADASFTAELTEVLADKRIAWKTVEGADHAGVVDFHWISDTTSQLTLQVDYEPEGFVETLGALTNLDRVLTNYDLGQFKTAVESGV